MTILYENNELEFELVIDERNDFEEEFFTHTVNWLNDNGVGNDFAIQRIDDMGEHLDDLFAFGVRFVNNGYLMEMDIIVDDHYGWGYNDCLSHCGMYMHKADDYYLAADFASNDYDVELEQKVFTEIINNKTFQEAVNKHITKQRLRLLSKGINYREVLIMGGK